MYFTPELINARDKYGYKIDVVYAYKFNKGFDVFKEFVEHFYTLKSGDSNPALKLIAKLILNSLYGKFGAREYHDETIMCPKGAR